MLIRFFLAATFVSSCVTYDEKIEQYDFVYQGDAELSEKQEFSKFSSDDQFCNKNAVSFALARSAKAQVTDQFVECMQARGWTAGLR